jgi:hypothetical protein
MAGLTKEQKEIIRMIEKEAKLAGIDPDFAVSLANIESGFRHVPAKVAEGQPPSTAFGPFQVNKATAKSNGVDYDEMVKSPELAVRTGIMNIVRHAKNPDLMTVNPDTGIKEIDPLRIAAAHRYGESSQYAKTGDRNLIDKTLANYLADAMDHFPEQTFPQTVYTKPTEKVAEQKIDMGTMPLGSTEPLPSSGEAIDMGSQPLAEYSAQEQNESDRRLAGAAGAGVGAFVGAVKVPAISIYKKAYDYLRRAPQVQDVNAIVEAANKVNEAKAAGQAGGQSGQPTRKVNVPMGTKDAGRMQAGQTGVMPYNYAKALGLTDIEAAQAVDMTKNVGGAHDLGAKRTEGMQRVQQIAPNQFAENPLYGGLLTQTPSVGGGPRASYAFKQPEVENGQVVQAGGLQQLPKGQPISSTPTPAKQPSVVRRATTGFGNAIGTVAGSSPIMGGLAGYGTLYNLQDAYSNYDQGNIPAAISSGIGSAASAASVIPKAAPYAGTVSALVDADRRRRERDYAGMFTSGVGAVAPYVAPFMFGPQVGIPVGVATAVGAPFANELKDYLQRGGDQTPAPKKAFRHRGFGLD